MLWVKMTESTGSLWPSMCFHVCPSVGQSCITPSPCGENSISVSSRFTCISIESMLKLKKTKIIQANETHDHTLVVWRKVKEMAAVDESLSGCEEEMRSKRDLRSCTQCSNGIFHGRKRIPAQKELRSKRWSCRSNNRCSAWYNRWPWCIWLWERWFYSRTLQQGKWSCSGIKKAGQIDCVIIDSQPAQKFVGE